MMRLTEWDLKQLNEKIYLGKHLFYMYSTHNQIKASWKYKSIFTQIWQKKKQQPQSRDIVNNMPTVQKIF